MNAVTKAAKPKSSKPTKAKPAPAKKPPAKKAAAPAKKPAAKPAVKKAVAARKPAAPVKKTPAKKPVVAAAKKPVAAKAKPAAKPVAKPAAKTTPKTAAKPAPKVAVKTASKPVSSKSTPAKAEKPVASKAQKAVKTATVPAKPAVRVVEPVKIPRNKVTTNVTILPPDYDPKKDKGEFMNPVMQEYFRQKLIRWREELLRESSETIQNTLQGTELQKPDLADRASAETDHALELRTRDRERKLISKINDALLRIEDGSYGYCEETGEPISVARLDARPNATLSLEAQERHERLERTHRDE